MLSSFHRLPTLTKREGESIVQAAHGDPTNRPAKISKHNSGALECVGFHVLRQASSYGNHHAIDVVGETTSHGDPHYDVIVSEAEFKDKETG